MMIWLVLFIALVVLVLGTLAVALVCHVLGI